MSDHVIFKKYTYDSLTGSKYHPMFDEHRKCWYMITYNNVMSIERIARLCDIPSDEVVFLKLQYGG